MFQSYSLMPWLTVRENVALAVDRVFAADSAAQRAERVMRYVAMVGLTPAADKKPAQLSGGMRQRVSVARALATDPDVLLLDEPLSALDALTRANLQDEIVRIWSEDRKTVLLITNDVDEALMMADRIIPLETGPRARLGPSFKVDIERPRDRREMNHDAALPGPARRDHRSTCWRWRTSATPDQGAQVIPLPALTPRDVDPGALAHGRGRCCGCATPRRSRPSTPVPSAPPRRRPTRWTASVARARRRPLRRLLAGRSRSTRASTARGRRPWSTAST